MEAIKRNADSVQTVRRNATRKGAMFLVYFASPVMKIVLGIGKWLSGRVGCRDKSSSGAEGWIKLPHERASCASRAR